LAQPVEQVEHPRPGRPNPLGGGQVQGQRRVQLSGRGFGAALPGHRQQRLAGAAVATHDSVREAAAHHLPEPMTWYAEGRAGGFVELLPARLGARVGQRSEEVEDHRAHSVMMPSGGAGW
jgi:hypothetical protein